MHTEERFTYRSHSRNTLSGGHSNNLKPAKLNGSSQREFRIALQFK